MVCSSRSLRSAAALHDLLVDQEQRPPPGVAVPGEEALRLLRAPLPRDLDPRARRLRRHDQVVPRPRHPVAGDPAEDEETALLVRDELERVGLSGQETGDELDRQGAGKGGRAVLTVKLVPGLLAGET